MTKDGGRIAPEIPAGLNRRDFLRRVAGASAVAAGACVLGLSLRDGTGPAALPEVKALPGLGDYALKDLASGSPRMAVVRGADRAAMFDLGVRALGGIEAFIKKGDRVLIKVNAAFASPAALGATTHPELLTAVASACVKAGASQVSVTDNPINNPESCFEITGLAGAARQTGARIVVPRAGLFTPATLPGARLIKDWPVLAGAFTGVTKLIALAPVKDHARAGASMLLKNMYGLLGGRRNVFHQDINGIISELALLTRPTLSILDGTVSMMSNGPTGGSLSDLKSTGTLVVTTDPVAGDAFGAGLLGRTLEDIPYIRLAQAAGAGTADFASLNPVYLDAGA
ncbi:DUF362 domain-containing protein [Fundidesulfovibrio terrae]|uniref:DUF362 domain-containing protein n=1 Tax=Fundidesulfovibrio terrae TaxID=2922866 RepID=UPI001FAFC90A